MLVVIPRPITSERGDRELKWSSNKYLFSTKEGNIEGLEEKNR